MTMVATPENGVVDSTAVEVYHAPPAALFGTNDPAEVIQKASQVADALRDVIRTKRLYANIQGKDHVLVEGWQLLGVMLGVTAVCVATEPVDGGFKATVEARTADGRVIGRAEALCTKHEKRGPWKTADDYARLSMAQTRATSKALKGPLGFVVSLAGYATTPAEEMPTRDPVGPVPVVDVTASEPRRTEPAATAAQRRLINAKAAEANLPSPVLANILLVTGGGEPKGDLSDAQATDAVKRMLDRLPKRLVDPVLEAINRAHEDVEL